MRVFVDTNVLVSALTARGLCADLFQAILADHVPVVSDTVLAEFDAVLRSKFRHSAGAAFERTQFLRRFCEHTPGGRPRVLAGIDAQDRKVIADALAGHAEALVTGDRAMLALEIIERMPLFSPRQLWDALRVA